MSSLQIRRLDGSKLSLYGEIVHSLCGVNGFKRSYKGMHVIKTSDGDFLATHVDTVAGIENAIIVQNLQDLSGFFGYCPLAISFYRSLAIEIRWAA